MNLVDLVAFAKATCEPVRDYGGAPVYRCAAFLTDGLYLPCVTLESPAGRVALAMRRFDEERAKPVARHPPAGAIGYGDIVEAFVAQGTSIAPHHIERVERSRFALPAARVAEIGGETSMGWTRFGGVMSDGATFTFATGLQVLFFDMPPGYTGDDVVHVIPNGAGEGTYRERPYFSCYVPGL